MRDESRHQDGCCENGRYLAIQPVKFKDKHEIKSLKEETTILSESCFTAAVKQEPINPHAIGKALKHKKS